ncbi:glycerol-3-phosphate phosphatase-like [Tubulanus polymorphus]|uniref:glycerol-3-phosphate phosphatase-like n=1 Tax=Tubulanus polymorphus TaxID=672921 RepID=UPI003DA3A5EF
MGNGVGLLGAAVKGQKTKKVLNEGSGSKNGITQNGIGNHNIHGVDHPAKFINSTNCRDILAKYDTILMDCDGVLWHMDQITPIPGIRNTMQILVKLDKELIFLSNNSLRSRASFQQRIKDEIGIDVPKKNIFCIPYLIAVYLKEIEPIQGKVYLIGRREMSDELAELGIPHVGVGADSDCIPFEPQDLFKQELLPDIGSVVVGFDSHFSYNKLFKAASYLSKPNCSFIGTSDNPSVMIANRLKAPVDGALVAAVSKASGRSPLFLGKPSEHCFDCIKRVHPNIRKSKTLVIGDCLSTDILFAKKCGLDSLMVLTGQSTLDEIDKHKRHSLSYCLPNYVAQSLADLGRYL